MTRAALFDIDGTLVTFKFDVRGTREAMREELTRNGFDVSALGPTSPTQAIIDEAKRQCDSGSVRVSYAAVRGKLYSILDRFEAESSKESTLFDGALGALDRLASSSVRLGVVTNSGALSASAVLDRYGLRSRFEFVLTRDDVEGMKPSPAGLQKAVSMLGIGAPDVFYVGDSIYDIRAARRAGVRMVSVATGNYPADRLRAEGADHVVESIAGVPDVVASPLRS